MKTEHNRKQDDEGIFDELVRRNGTTWIVSQLRDLGGTQLILLHVGNLLSTGPCPSDDTSMLFALIEKLNKELGFWGSLDSALWELHSDGYPMEPKPGVIESFKLHLGDKTESVLNTLRRRGHSYRGRHSTRVLQVGY